MKRNFMPFVLAIAVSSAAAARPAWELGRDAIELSVRNPETAFRDGIHWSREGYRLMAEEIIREIERHLARP